MSENAPQAAPAQKFLVIKKNWCKRCGICIWICPKQVIDRLQDGTVEIVHLDRCISCGLCVAHCPDYAIFGDPETYAVFENR